jgi:hypothetical protein
MTKNKNRNTLEKSGSATLLQARHSIFHFFPMFKLATLEPFFYRSPQPQTGRESYRDVTIARF